MDIEIIKLWSGSNLQDILDNKGNKNRILKISAKRFAYALLLLKMQIILKTMVFEPTGAERIGSAAQRLNHSASSSVDNLKIN